MNGKVTVLPNLGYMIYQKGFCFVIKDAFSLALRVRERPYFMFTYLLITSPKYLVCNLRASELQERKLYFSSKYKTI